MQRKSKHDVAEPTHQNILGESSTSTDVEKLLRLRESLINCQRMMDIALDHLEYFRDELNSPFIDENEKQVDFSTDLWGSEFAKFDTFHPALKDKISKTTKTITTEAINSGALIGNKIIQELIEQTKPNLSSQLRCPFCITPGESSQLPSVPKTKTVSGEALYRLCRLTEHVNNPTHRNYNGDHMGLQWEDLDIVFRLMAEVKTEFESAISDVGLIDFLPLSIGRNLMFVPTSVCINSIFFTKGGLDCLGRLDLHRIADSPNRLETLRLSQEIKLITGERINRLNHQDILGRTVLHIAGQNGWTDVVKVLMENGATPDLRTIHGTLPLHYAVLSESLKPETVVELYKLTLSRTLDLSDNAGNDPLMYLIHSDSYGRLETLVESGYEVLAVHIRKAIQLNVSFMLDDLLPGFHSTYDELYNSLLDGDPVQVRPEDWAKINSHYGFGRNVLPVG